MQCITADTRQVARYHLSQAEQTRLLSVLMCKQHLISTAASNVQTNGAMQT